MPGSCSAMLPQYSVFFIPRISWCRNKMQTWNGKTNTAWWCTESMGATWHNGAMTYVTWHEDEEAAIQFDHAVMLAWIWFSWLLKWWGLLLLVFCARWHLLITWQYCKGIRYSKVDIVLARLLLWQHAENLPFINALDFCCQVSEINRNWAVLFLDTVAFGNKILWSPTNVKTYAMRLEFIHPNKLRKFKGW